MSPSELELMVNRANLPWAIGLGIFLTLMFGVGLSARISTDYDPEDPVPTTFVLVLLGVVMLGNWIYVAYWWGR
jgi:hypothetical protein